MTKPNKLSQATITNNGESLNINALLQAKGLPDHRNQNSEGSTEAQSALYNTAKPYSDGKAMAQAALEAQVGLGVTPTSTAPSPYPSSGYNEGDDEHSKKPCGKNS